MAKISKLKTLKKLLKVKQDIFQKPTKLNKVEEVIKSVVLQDLPLSFLSLYKEHKRLKVFYHKGVICCFCGVVGIRLIERVDPTGGIHLDVFTNKLEMMTVDHIIPKSLGGDMSLDNLRPMCKSCNCKRQTNIVGNELELFLGCQIY